MASYGNTAYSILAEDFTTEAPGLRSVYLGFERQAPGHTSPHIVYPRRYFEPILHLSPDSCVARSTTLLPLIIVERKSEQGYYSFVF